MPAVLLDPLVVCRISTRGSKPSEIPFFKTFMFSNIKIQHFISYSEKIFLRKIEIKKKQGKPFPNEPFANLKHYEDQKI